MKIRNGFVSNSSSSSFVVLLPDDYKLKEESVEAFLTSEKFWGDEDCEVSSVAEAFKNLLTDKMLLADECRVGEFDVLTELLKDYVIADLNGGPDEGTIILANRDKIKEIIK